jgi:hypothetical protein
MFCTVAVLFSEFTEAANVPWLIPRLLPAFLAPGAGCVEKAHAFCKRRGG